MYQRKLPRKFFCTVEYALSLFNGKWKARIICEIGSHQVIRYSQLKKNIIDASDAALSASLHELKRDNLITRKQYNEMPIRVEYSLTPAGKELLEVFNQLSKWATKYSKESDYQGNHFQQVHKQDFENHSEN